MTYPGDKGFIAGWSNSINQKAQPPRYAQSDSAADKTPAEFVDYRRDNNQGTLEYPVFWVCHWLNGKLHCCVENKPHRTWESAQTAAVAYASKMMLGFEGEGPSFG